MASAKLRFACLSALAVVSLPTRASPDYNNTYDEILYTVSHDYFGQINSAPAASLPPVEVIGRRVWQTICVGQSCADLLQSISDAQLTAALLRLNQLAPEQVLATLRNPRKDVRCYVPVPGFSPEDAASIHNTTSASSPEQKWIAAEAMYRWFATTTPRVAQALNREIINGALAFRVTFADGGSAAYQILQVIPTPISPSLSESPIPNTETAGTGSPAPGANC